MSRSLLGGREHQITHANVDIELNGVYLRLHFLSQFWSFRYELLWLPVIAQSSVWHLHMLSPLNYERDCHEIVSIQRRLPFTPSIRVEILGVNIQCCSLSKRKLKKSEDVIVSIGKFKRKRKNASIIQPIAYNF